MRVIKENGDFGLNVCFNEEDKNLTFNFGGNGDLYWTISNMNSDESEDFNYEYFVITKENYEVYKLFEQLFLDIENINIFNEEKIPFYIEEDEKQAYLENREEERKVMKERCHLFNHSNYNELFDAGNRIITWYSDETAHEVSNILKIKQEEDTFKIQFYTQPHTDGYDEDFHFSGYITVRFRNSGSTYDPFNFVFMRMYNNMREIDDVNDYGHQMHIEEYLYNKKYVKRN